MRYILDSSGYVESVSCTPFNCKDKSCKEYTGSIPSGYDSLEEWATTANIRAYKITSGNLVYDSARDAALQAEWEKTNETTEIAMTAGYTLSGAAFGKQPILEKHGKVVHLAMLVVAENGFVDTLTGIGRLPAGFRPKYTQVFPCGLANAHLWYMDSVGYLNIGADGYINIRNSTGTKKYAFINITYMTE